ncbi:CoA transferase [Alphaproteobacteria bacterium]|nr:CoA transferase [Alphaproteobacteria bacterium]
MSEGPLKNIRIIDASSILMVPYCTRLLADMGAEVIKVETIEGDNTRFIGPAKNEGMAAVYLSINRNKKSICIDIKSQEGQSIINKLIKTSDVFVSNIRKAALKRIGLTHSNFIKINPKIITANAVGFSSKGAYAGLPAFDDTIQAISGMAAFQEAYSSQPSYTAGATADKVTGLMLGMAIIAALFKSTKSGKGSEIEVPMMETMVDFTLVEHLYGYNFIPPKGPPIYPRQSSPNRRPFKTLDGYIAVMPYNDNQWLRFFKMINKEDILDNKKFSSLNARNENIDLLYSLLSDELKKNTTNYWIDNLKKNDIPSMNVNTPESLFEDEHLKSTQFFKVNSHPTEGKLLYTSFPVNFNEDDDSKTKHAPNLGEHTKDILYELGYTNTDLKKLASEGIIKFKDKK